MGQVIVRVLKTATFSLIILVVEQKMKISQTDLNYLSLYAILLCKLIHSIGGKIVKHCVLMRL